jgi:hypothetical protein
MKFRCLVAALALLAAFASDSWGQSKQPPKIQTQPATQQAAPDQRGTENSPIVVKVLPTQENEERAKADAKEHDEKRKLDRDTLWLSAATVTIIFFQLLIFGAQAYFLWGTLRATATAAKAAIIAAEHIPRVERAYLFVGPSQADEMWKQDETGQAHHRITSVGLIFENQGKTPALIRRVYGQFSEAMPTEDIPHYEGGVIVMFDNAIPGGSKQTRERMFESGILGPQYFFGFVEYDDIFREKLKISRFCVHLLPQEQRFDLAGPRSWNDWT